MDTLHETWSHEPTRLLFCGPQNSGLCFCVRGKKNGKVNSFFFFSFRCQQATDLVLSSYFQQCALNQNISYLVHLDIGLIRNSTEKAEKNAAYYSTSLKLLQYIYTYLLHLNSPSTSLCLACHLWRLYGEKVPSNLVHYKLIQYHMLYFRSIWNSRGSLLPALTSLVSRMNTQTAPDDPQTIYVKIPY